MDLNYIDIVLGIILIVAAILGYRKGFIVEIASLVAVIVGVWGAINYSDVVADILINDLHVSLQNINLIAFIVTFVLIILLVLAIGRITTLIVKAMALSFLNRLAGLVFSTLKFAIIISFALMFFDQFDEQAHIIDEDVKKESKLYQPIKQIAPSILPFLSDWTYDLKEKYLEKEEYKNVDY